MSYNHFHDVVVVGAGPVGLALGRMLGLQGHDVLILERWPQPYPLPRAVHFDDEIGRVFQAMGLSAEIKAISDPVPDFYEWRNAAGDALVRIDWSGTGPCGWPTASFFSQPELERTLASAVERMPNVTLHRGATVVDVDDRGTDVKVTFQANERQTVDVYSRFVIGCDGANSFVRDRMGATSHDLGFFFDWLIVDTIPLDQQEWSPMNWQLCDPARPTTVVSGGPGRRRWEFMRLPGEDLEVLNTTDRAWELLRPWGRTPENTRLERHAVYSFAARWADRWNSGRLAIAGDAAHLMPPFAGQGMCSGLRDAANISWKLDRVLRGKSARALLDSYTSERSIHLQHAITMSVELGKVICVLDDAQATERDQRMIAAGADPRRVLPVTALPVLGPGVTADGIDHAPLRGTLLPQFPVAHQGRVDLLDNATGPSALLLIHGDDASVAGLSMDLLQGSGVQVMTIAETGSPDLVDQNHCWTEWFNHNEVECVLVRPDRYIFGALASAADLAQLAVQYHRKLHACDETAAASETQTAASVQL
ncbi:2-polyprenyl-6-methoxyphenol hydroxylase-like FAD-dependent oxidoreductase [Mycobacterium sp. OAS707]|uniref:bifunctional 3-(3-hydroxy-phenyl)propionate/3-hydroxycinnamic acid hydroxylase MhpA n=1 Tax=Mycobacterium sp. OAS707 TaxID=2663822 RepID=UPI0017892E46|nr:bifunctional 3-(3-hydroxy-phenyl)propionate/3-hydroxycinnamic acid hydroxylase [Mycobacterium sp. OAS707]MBE1549615.1 2-polyprenyl-6-methoxyphenol hydroxylase-like FAD-dependent oxidoreductase [Mycobacterium sp. OAS707]